MKTQHTPGPWEIRYEKSGRTIDTVIKISTASVYFTRGLGQIFEDQQANARLIAAAPDLLDALNVLLDKLLAPAPGLIAVRHMDSAIRKAEIAIAKAKGE